MFGIEIQSAPGGSGASADTATLESLADFFAYSISDLRGERVNLPGGGIADAYDSETDVDTATSTNEIYSSSNDLYSPATQTTDITINSGVSGTSTGFTLIDRTTALVAGREIVKLGIYSTSAATIKVKIYERLTSSTGTFVVDQSYSHPGGGWSDCTLSSPYTVPGSGTFYLGAYSAGNVDLLTSNVTRTFKSGDVTGSATGMSEDTATGKTYAMRYSYASGFENMTIVSNGFTATAVPTVARIASFIDPQVAITINTDFTAEVSRDGGTTYTAVTLALVSNPVGTVEQYEGTVSVAAQPSGSSMKYRLKTLNNKDIDVTGTVLRWGD